MQLLLTEWTEGLKLTTIPQAVERLRLPADQRLRWNVAERIEGLWRDALTSPEKRAGIAAALGRPYDPDQDEQWRRQVGAWQLASLILSEDEKLVARCVLAHRRQRRRLPRPTEIATSLSVPVQKVHGALRLLGRLGFLLIADSRRPGDYRLAGNHARFLEGLGFTFHTVTLHTGERFGVP